MATHQIEILGAATTPDDSGEVFIQKYSTIDTTLSNSDLDPLCLMFNDSSAVDTVRGAFIIPQNYVGTPKIVIHWTANATSGTTQWDWIVLPRTAAEDMGAAAARTTETVSDTKTGTAFVLETVSITLTAGDYAAGDVVLFALGRDSVTDSMAATACVFTVLFEYADA